MTHTSISIGGRVHVVSLDPDSRAFAVTGPDGSELVGHLVHGQAVGALGRVVTGMHPRALEALRRLALGEDFASAPARDIAPHHAGGEP